MDFCPSGRKMVAVSGGSKFSALKVSGSDFLEVKSWLGLEFLIMLESRSGILKPFTLLYP